MTPWRRREVVEHWMIAAGEAISLGSKAVDDRIRVATGSDVVLHGIYLRDGGEGSDLHVTIRWNERGASEASLEGSFFTLRRSRRQPRTWAESLAWMKSRQEGMPPHLAGLETNVSEKEYNNVLDYIRRRTGYEGLAVGDLTVHETAKGDIVPLGPFSPPPHYRQCEPGQLSVFALTQAGNIARSKLIDIVEAEMKAKQENA